MKYLFGPVPSRRLGVSLGVDLVPHKVCSLNCVYCEVGKTTNLTIERKEYVPIEDVIKELDEYLFENPDLDFITFSGQGEPTLNSGIGRVINHIKEKYPRYKVAVLTNGTLFWNEQVRAEVMPADVILPDLDAVSDLVFRKLNRPHPELDIGKIIDGLIRLRREFTGEIHIEVFMVPGLNDTRSELTLLRETLLRINPDIVQLNTLDRPGTENWVQPLEHEKLREIVEFFQPLNTEIVASPQSRKKIQSFHEDIAGQILETIRRRPCTDKDLSEILGLHPNELNKYLSELIDAGKIESEELPRGVFFKLKTPSTE